MGPRSAAATGDNGRASTDDMLRFPPLSFSSTLRPRRRPILLMASDCVQQHQDLSSSSSSEEDDVENAEYEEEEGNPIPEQDYVSASTDSKRNRFKDVTASAATSKGKSPISLSLKKFCKVCKESGHQAGFQGATYIDCPKKPCFLCKLPGHTTLTCPHRVAMEHGVVPAPRRCNLTFLDYVFHRQLQPNIPTIKPSFVIPNQVDRGLIKFHSRRVTCLEFHPTKNGILLSGDKKGQLGIWDYVKLQEKTIYESVHSCILNHMKFNPTNDCTIFTSSSDGTVSCTDLETGTSHRLMDLNPDGWNFLFVNPTSVPFHVLKVHHQGPANWRMLYGLDVNTEKGLLLVADNFGFLYILDARSKKMLESILIHKKGSKVVSLHCNPLQPDLLLSCGNDHYARLWDARRLEDGSSLRNLAHGRVVNSGYFSPKTGSKILTTSQDNRIRVWESIFGDLEHPVKEIVHSHDFNRHLTPFRAEWDPKDSSESLIVIGRYISENYNGLALHPIDFIDTKTAQLVAEVTEPAITTICPVNKLHPLEDVMASGSSRSLFIWKPKEDFELTGEDKLVNKPKQFIIENPGKKSSGKFDAGIEDDDEDDVLFHSKVKGKKRKTEK